MTSVTGEGQKAGIGLLKGCGIALGVISGLVLLAIGIVYVQFAESSKSEPLVLDGLWETWEIELRAGEAANGRIRIVMPGEGATSQARASLSISLPATDPSSPAPVPNELLVVPAVRLTVLDGTGSASTCLAPCEQMLGSGSLDYKVVVEAPGGETVQSLRVTVGAAVIAPLGSPLPDGLDVELGPAGPAAGDG